VERRSGVIFLLFAGFFFCRLGTGWRCTPASFRAALFLVALPKAKRRGGKLADEEPDDEAYHFSSPP
jgi:hypothetical protein